MTDSHYSNAMTEIALALAMGFFSVMVLAMVSMGAGFQTASDTTAATLTVQAAAPGGTAASPDDTLVVHFQGRFLNAAMKPIDPKAVTTEGRLVLAIEPTLSMARAIALRDQFSVETIVVTTLDDRWLATLKENSR